MNIPDAFICEIYYYTSNDKQYWQTLQWII